jgi:hypothetical protein
MDILNAVELADYPYFFAIRLPEPDIDGYNWMIWISKPAVLDNEAIDKQWKHRPDGKIILKNKEKKAEILDFRQVCEALDKSFEENRIRAERHKRPSEAPVDDVTKRLRNLRMDLWMTYNEILLKCKHRDTNFLKLQALKPSHDAALKALQDFDDDYPDIVAGMNNAKKIPRYVDPEIRQEVDDALKVLSDLEASMVERFGVKRWGFIKTI